MEIKKVLYLLRIICWYQICKFTRGLSWTTSILDPGLAVDICDSVEQLQPAFLSPCWINSVFLCFWCQPKRSKREGCKDGVVAQVWFILSKPPSELCSPSPRQQRPKKKSPENCFTKNGNGICIKYKVERWKFCPIHACYNVQFYHLPIQYQRNFPFPKYFVFPLVIVFVYRNRLCSSKTFWTSGNIPG